MTNNTPLARPTTLAELKARLNADSTLSEQQRREKRSAINLIAKAAGKAAEHLPAAPAQLTLTLADRTVPARIGVSPRRWQNAKSLFVAAAKQYGVARATAHALQSEWRQLYNVLPSKREKAGLSSFFHFCGSHSIAPADVGDETSAAFKNYMETVTTVSRTQAIVRRAIRLWNELAVSELYGELRPLKLEGRRNKYQIAETEWSHSLVAEIDAMFEYMQGNDPTRDPPPSGYWAPSTAATNRRYLRAIVSAVCLGGRKLHQLSEIAILVEPDSLEAFASFFQSHIGKPTNYLHSICTFLLHLARHWLRADEQTIDAITRMRRRMGKEQQQLTTKNRKLLSHIETAGLIRPILQLPDTLAKEARALKDPVRAAVRMQMAVGVGILTRAPMRSGNLVKLQVKQHFSGLDGRNSKLTIHLPGHEVKNGLDLTYELDEQLSELIKCYLREYQPILDRTEAGWLFPGTSKSYKTQPTFSQQITELTERKLGHRITPHQFRHIAAKIYLDANPGAYVVVKQFLGHKNLMTTTRAYTDLDMSRATRLLDSTIQSQLSGGHQ